MEELNTNKFVENTLSFRRMVPLEDDTVTALNLLVTMMRGRTEKYPTREAFTKARNNAYAAGVVVGLSGYGNQVLIDNRIKYIHSRYLEDASYLDKILDLSEQMLFHPLLEQEVLDEAKYLLKNRILNAQEDPDTLALWQALEIAQPGHPISIPIQGRLEEIDQITLEDIQNLYARIAQAPIQVLAVGEIEEPIRAWMEGLPQTVWQRKDARLIEGKEPNCRTLYRDVAQSSLAQIYATHVDPREEQAFALMVANSILGSAPMSLLFEEVREKHSYCYSIASFIIRFDGALAILTGCAKENLDHVRQLTRQQIERLQKGDFEDYKLEAAKLDILDSLNSQQDSDVSLLAQRFLNEFLQRELSAEQLKEKIQAVRKEDVMKAASLWTLASQCIVCPQEDLSESTEQSLLEADKEPGRQEETLQDMTKGDA